MNDWCNDPGPFNTDAPPTITVCGLCLAIDLACDCIDPADGVLTLERDGRIRIDKDGNWTLEIR